MASSTYTGPSIVDYLASTGQKSDFNTRASLASKYGITNYQGTAEQNTQLLNTLRNAGSSTTPAVPASPGTAATAAPNNTQTPVNQSAYNTPAAQATPETPPVIDLASILNAVRNGQIDPGQIDAYVNNLTTQAYTKTGPTGTVIDSAGAAARAREIAGQLNGISFSYGGQNYQYAPGGSIRTSTAVTQSKTGAGGTTAATTAIPGAAAPIVPQQPAPVAPTTPAAPVAPAVAPPIVGAPAAAPLPAGGAPAGGGGSTYNGASVVDYLNSVGQASDFNSRAKLAASLGIAGYTGTAAQNTLMLNTLRNKNGGSNTTTASTAAAGGANGAQGAGTVAPDGSSPEVNSVIENAKAIAKSFGWVAPDANNSPLNIATNLFTQGLAAYGLNDIKTQINGVLEQQNELLNKKADEAGEINSNPWLTEGERVARLGKLDDKYSTKLDILVHQLQLYEADYKTGLDQVQWQVGQAMDAYKLATTANDKLFSDALSIAENVLQSSATLKKEQDAASKPVVVGAGSTLVDPKTGKPLYTAPSKAVDTLTPASTNDASVRAGVDIDTFKTFPADVQAFFSQKTDADIEPIKQALTDVAQGDMTAAEFNAEIDKGALGALAPSVKAFLKAQAAEAEKAAPKKDPNASVWWNPLTWF